ncbi:hypothetical protein AB0395_33100 [Streptosporangium sp. NPDC051023]|uniref:hypothetical protein n=1 Tax=Streptosporangium sp. NPDC051023 TaxID=3155410 RepID=UPI00344D5C48
MTGAPVPGQTAPAWPGTTHTHTVIDRSPSPVLDSPLFTLYAVGAFIGFAAFTIKAAATPHITRYYFEQEVPKAAGSPWAGFFAGLIMMSALWPIGLLILVTQRWWAPKFQKHMEDQQENRG